MKTLVAQAIPRRDSDEGVAAVGIRESRNGKPRHFRQLQESRSSKSVLDLQQSFPLRNMRGRLSKSRVMMAFNEPHLTRLCHFVWKPINKTASHWIMGFADKCLGLG